MFYRNDRNSYIHFTKHPEDRQTGKLPAGVYRFHEPEMFSPPMFEPITMTERSVVELETGAYHDVLRATRMFFHPDTGRKAGSYRVPHRLGVLLHGPQGTGKTTLIHKMAQEMIAERDVVVLLDVDLDAMDQAVRMVREQDPERPIIVVWEEFDQWAQDEEHHVKGVLDGLNSPEHVLFVATTNYLERIPDTLANRPGRFGFVTHVGFFDMDERQVFVERLLDEMNVEPQDRANLDTDAVLVYTEGKSADEIKHVLLNALVYGLSLEETMGQMETAARHRDEAQEKAARRKERFRQLRAQGVGGRELRQAMEADPFA